MKLVKILMIIVLSSTFVVSLNTKRDDSLRYGYQVYTSNVEVTQNNRSKINAILYVNEDFARYDFDLWGEAKITEIIVKYDINPIKATICQKHCDVSVLDSIPAFNIPQSAEYISTQDICQIDHTRSCDVWKFDIDAQNVGYGYVSRDQILAIEVKSSSGEHLSQIVFQDMIPSVPDSIFNIPDTCECKGSVCFLIDGSESVLKTSFADSQKRIGDVLNYENPMKFDIDMSAIQFATKSRVISSMTRSKDSFLATLNNETKQGGLTDIYAGLSECVKELDSSDENTEKSIILITDGSYTNHPQLMGDPKSYASSIRQKGISIRVGAIESELFFNRDLIENISTSKECIFNEVDSTKSVVSKVLNPLCISPICKSLNCDKGYCGCGGCICPPGNEGDVCRSNNPSFENPNLEPSFNGTDVVPPPASKTNVGAIVGGIIGALAGLAIIAAIIFGITRYARKKAEVDMVDGGNAMASNEALNPVYEQQGVGGENPLYEG